MRAVLPENEDERVQELRGYGVLDTPPESDFDNVAALAASICRAPIALVSLVDSGRQWFKAKTGLTVSEMSRDIAFCAHAILQQDLFVVPDAAADERFAANPLVSAPPHIRFYAGAPLITPSGYALGTLCVLDHVPRTLSAEEQKSLQILSAEVVAQLELRRVHRKLLESQAEAETRDAALREASQFNREILEGAPSGIIVYDTELRYRVFNPFMQQLTGKKADEVLGKYAYEVFPALRSSGIEAMIRRALEGEVVHAPDLLIRMHSAGGRDVWESCIFAPYRNANGKIVGAIGLIRDLTERHIAEETFRSIVVGTAAATGADFFASLVRHMASALQARYAFITSCDDQKHAKSLAFWDGDKFGKSFEFDIADTPCMKVLHGEVCHYRQDLQQLFPLDTGLADWGAESYLGVPMLDTAGRVIGHIAILDDKPMERDDHAIDLIRIFAARAAAELKRQRAESELQAALQQVQVLQKKLEAENVYLQEEIRKEHNFEEIVGNSPVLLDVLRKVETVAPTDSTVLVLGETGCGKELIARAIHSRSKRKDRPLVKVNCGAIPTGLVESELFGHMRGAFTGALERRTGRFELADGGTLFLDEVSELPLDTQVKLLRVLQEHEFEPLGSSRTVRVNVRIIAASNRDLEQFVKEGRFRADLYYRLNVLPVLLPPLRQRRSDLPLLAAFFVDRFSRQFGRQITGIAQETMDILIRYDWPGNIRELQNVIERAVVLSRGQVLRLGPDLSPLTDAAPTDPGEIASLGSQGQVASDGGKHSLEEVEKRHIFEVLRQTEWVIEGPRGAAKILNLHPNTLRSRMKKLGIERSRART
jgi:formate hydrogenlyase transcriptional activator